MNRKIETKIFKDGENGDLFKKDKKISVFEDILLWVTVFVVTAVLAGGTFVFGNFSRVNGQIDDLRAEIVSAEKSIVIAEKSPDIERGVIKKQKVQYVRAFEQIKNSVPAGVVMKRVFAGSGGIVVSGEVQNVSKIERFIENMRGREKIGDVVLKNVQNNIFELWVGVKNGEVEIDGDVRENFAKNARSLPVKVELPAPLALNARGETFAPTDGRILLTWKGPTDVVEWLIFAAREPNEWQLAGTSTMSEYVFKTGEPRKVFDFKVMGVAQDGKRTGESEAISASAGENMAPGVVENVSVSRRQKINGKWEITLGWADVKYGWRYHVYRGGDAESVELIDTVYKNSVSFENEFAEVSGRFLVIAESVDGIMGY